MSAPAFITSQADGVLVSIKLQPRASADEIGEPLGNELRVRVTAPPVDAAANEALLKLIAREWKHPRSRMELVRGHTSRHKTLKLYGISAEALLAKLS
ncbi:MAG TPA: DUF167 domain-containing protein [Clostridia bacterium]|nr:DUF167 domain-containing protein [Clostridia bacterium]